MGGIDLGLVWLILMAVLWLVFLEGLLSADNALVMAMMVRHLPRDMQKRVLFYGLVGALVFRIIAVFTAKLLLDFWFLQVGGGLYLLYLTGAHYLSGQGDSADGVPNRRMSGGFWGAVVSVELADIAFSIDSILAAVATAKGLPIRPSGQVWIVITGGCLGVITMRYVASYFILLIERFRGLETAAYGLVAWIGLKLVIDGLVKAGYHAHEMNTWIFWIGMLAIVVMGFLYKPRGPSRP
jgi:YkoY family integral membrane protein